METLDFYNQKAESFFNTTVTVEMSELYHPFLKLLPDKAHILDLGCGSGRDSLAFKQSGYQVTAVDGSKELAGLASELIGQNVLLKRFDEIEFQNEFDAVWACASLLHIPKTDMKSILPRIIKTLKPGGIIYASFKYGSAEYSKDERLFNCYDENNISELINDFGAVKLLKLWITEDLRPTRKHERWINILLARSD